MNFTEGLEKAIIDKDLPVLRSGLPPVSQKGAERRAVEAPPARLGSDTRQKCATTP